MGMAKPIPAVVPVRRINGGVDANYFTVGVDERAAGVAAIDGRIGLNGFVDETWSGWFARYGPGR